MDTSHRIGQQGGGLALVSSNMLNATKVDEDNKRTFQFAIWKVSCKEYTISIIGVYHPPYSTVNQCTYAMFLGEFTESLPDQLAKYKMLSLWETLISILTMLMIQMPPHLKTS